MSWPGWDGILVAICAGVVVAAAAAKGVRGLEPWVVGVLAVDAAWLGVAWWRRR